jgi:hypothetical protein
MGWKSMLPVMVLHLVILLAVSAVILEAPKNTLDSRACSMGFLQSYSWLSTTFHHGL